MAVDKFRLIEEVRQRPLLWDFQHVAVQRNSKKCDELWNEIGQLLDIDASICKHTWLRLRAQFCNEAKRIKMRIALAKKAGSYAPNKQYYSWAFFDSLRFLANGLSSRATCDLNFENDFDSNNTEIVESSNTYQIKLQLFDSNSSQTETDGIEIAESAHLDEIQRQAPRYSEDYDECDDNVQMVANDDFDQKPLENNLLQKESDSTMPIIPIRDVNRSQSQDTNFKLYTVSISSCAQDNECAKMLNDNNALQSDTVVKKEPELEIKTEKHPLENEEVESAADLTDCSENSNLLAYNDLEEFISSPLGANDEVKQEHISSSPGSNDEDYSFLYSFLSQTKVMTQLQKIEFRANMKKLLVHTFPAASSVNILEKQLLLPKDNDPDRKFLISFWPFIKSMSLLQNLQFRLKMTELVYKILLRDTNQ